jgi:hypothetical protein
MTKLSIANDSQQQQKPLSREHKEFADMYLNNFSVKLCADHINRHRATLSRWLLREDVSDYIATEMEKRRARSRLDFDKLLEEIALMINSDITDYLDVSKAFGDVHILTVKDLTKLPKELTKVIQSVKTSIDSMTGLPVIEIKLHSKTQAMQMVLQHISTMVETLKKLKGEEDEVQLPGAGVRVLGAPRTDYSISEWETETSRAEVLKERIRAAEEMDNNVIDAEVIEDA